MSRCQCGLPCPLSTCSLDTVSLFINSADENMLNKTSIGRFTSLFGNRRPVQTTEYGVHCFHDQCTPVLIHARFGLLLPPHHLTYKSVPSKNPDLLHFFLPFSCIQSFLLLDVLKGFDVIKPRTTLLNPHTLNGPMGNPYFIFLRLCRLSLCSGLSANLRVGLKSETRRKIGVPGPCSA
jgi:hypothetical protein